MNFSRSRAWRGFLTPSAYVSLLALIVLFLLPLLPRNRFYEDLLVMIFFWAALGAAWNLVGGFAGQLSLGHTAFFGIGAYTSTLLYLQYGISPWIGMFAGAGLSILVAIGIGYPCFRLQSHFFALATVAFAEVVRLIALYWRGLTKGGVGLIIPFKPGLENMIFQSKLPYAYIALVFMLVVIGVSYWIQNSRFGYSLVAIREDQDAAETLGVKTTKYKLIALIISTFFTSLGGTFYSQYLLFIDPDNVFSLNVSIELALMSIIGGVGTVAGPIIGSFLLTPLDTLLRGWLGGVFAGFSFIVYGLVLMFAAMFFSKGIVAVIQPWMMKALGNLPGARAARREEKVFHRSIPDPSSLHPKIATDSPFLQVQSIRKRFGGIMAVKDVSFDIRKGEIVGLIGPNGAGKTTLFNLISGFYPPDGGRIKLKGEDITGLHPPHRLCLKRIGRTFQLVKPFRDMTVLENVMLGAFSRLKGMEEARQEALEVIELIGLTSHRDSLASSLTIADRKRLELGRALATRPELLLLDEVMAGLTPKETEEIIGIIRSIAGSGVTMLIIEHVMKVIMTLSDRIVVVHHGERIAEGKPAEISKNRVVIEAYLGEEYIA
jgi:branched-chain amino acid transport system permease protein